MSGTLCLHGTDNSRRERDLLSPVARIDPKLHAGYAPRRAMSLRTEASGADRGGAFETQRVLSVGFVLLRSFTLTPFSTFVDALRLAGDEGDMSRPIRCRWSILAPTLNPIRSSCGVEVAPWETFSEPERFDYIVVVGGLLHRGPQCDEITLGFLREAAAKGVSLVGLCTATFALLRAGVMSGRRCCVSWFHVDDFRRAFPDVKPVADRVFVVDQGRITCAGGAGALDVAAWIIERHLGRVIAQKCLHILVVDRARTLRAAQPHPLAAEVTADQRVRRAILLIEQNLAKALPVQALAKAVGLSERQLERLFARDVGVRPSSYARQVRLRYASFLLETTHQPIAEIALDCGFADAAHLTRAFHVVYGTTPARARHAAAGASRPAA